MPTSVVIADDHAVTVIGLETAIASLPNFEVVGVAKNGIEAIALIKKHRPDCAVLDLSMPGANGLEVFVEAKRWAPKTRIAIVTGNPSAAIFSQLVEAGVDGLFLKNTPLDRLCDGIQRMAGGARVMASEIAPYVGESASIPTLTSRELQVLHGIAKGYSNGQIGDMLGVSPKTVDSHRTSLMRKMGAHSTATLLVRAMRDGLIDV